MTSLKLFRPPSARATTRLGAAILCATLGLSGHALAQSPGVPEDEPPLFHDNPLTEEAEQAIRQFLDAIGPVLRRLEMLVRDLPAYEAPEVLPNGDILIRRKHRQEEPGQEEPEQEPPPAADEPEPRIKT